MPGEGTYGVIPLLIIPEKSNKWCVFFHQKQNVPGSHPFDLDFEPQPDLTGEILEEEQLFVGAAVDD